MLMAPAMLDVLCEDGPVIAVNKPPGVVVQGAPRGVENLADIVRRYLKEKYDKPGNVYLGVPHRLDRPVSGVVVFARNSKAAARLSEQFAERQVRKTYRAMLERPPEAPSGTLVDWLKRKVENEDEHNDREPKVFVTSSDDPGAKRAALSYRTLWTGKGRALVEVDLETGRMHQIRVQFASRGCPIVGDVQYGAREDWTPRTGAPARSESTGGWRFRPIALHAYRLTIRHPIRYDELPITAPLPATWREFDLPPAMFDATAS